MICTVNRCQSKRGQFDFIGDFCRPCHIFITEGRGAGSQAFRNACAVASEILRRMVESDLKDSGEQVLLPPWSTKEDPA